MERFRSSIQFVLLPYGQLLRTLDATKVADYTVLGLSAEQEVNSEGENLLRCLQAQGFPQTVAVVPHVSSQQTLIRSIFHFCSGQLKRREKEDQPEIAPKHVQIPPLVHAVLHPIPHARLRHLLPCRGPHRPPVPLRGKASGHKMAHGEAVPPLRGRPVRLRPCSNGRRTSRE